MAANALSSFRIEREGEDTLLRIEADDGMSWEFAATSRQVERLREKVEDILDDP